MSKQKKRDKAGRPPEGRQRMSVHVLPVTAGDIADLIDRENKAMNTQGKVIDHAISRLTKKG